MAGLDGNLNATDIVAQVGLNDSLHRSTPWQCWSSNGNRESRWNYLKDLPLNDYSIGAVRGAGASAAFCWTMLLVLRTGQRTATALEWEIFLRFSISPLSGPLECHHH